MAIRVSPSFLAFQKRGGIGQAFTAYQTLQSRQPVVVVMRSIVGLTPVGGGSEFGGEGVGPLFPGEMAFGG